jgi:hypothetical protein
MGELFKSKKFVVAMIGVATVVVVALLAKLGVPIPEDDVNKALMLLGTYVLGQGVADIGKERAKTEAATVTTPIVNVATVGTVTTTAPAAKKKAPIATDLK